MDLLVVARLLTTISLLCISVWGVLALHFQLNGWQAKVWIVLWGLAVVLATVLLWRQRLWMGLAAVFFLWLTLALWWNTYTPSNDQKWSADVAQMSHGQVQGDTLYLYNVRNFTWRSNTDFDARWEDRTYDLNQLRSLDLLTSYWGLPAIAHVLVSFGFADGRQLAFSVEIRKKQGQAYSEIGGFFKQFELSIVAADEGDVIRVRTNVRNEDVYLYRINMPAHLIRELLESYVEQANSLIKRPRFYNTVTANCTTIVYAMVRQIVDGLPLDYRLLLSGYLPGYVAEMGGLQPGINLEQLRSAGYISERAKAVGTAEDFSASIREGVPGW